jgi:hypothetical protein
MTRAGDSCVPKRFVCILRLWRSRRIREGNRAPHAIDQRDASTPRVRAAEETIDASADEVHIVYSTRELLDYIGVVIKKSRQATNKPPSAM